MKLHALRHKIAEKVAGPEEPPETMAAFVRDVYRAVLQREPDAGALEQAVQALGKGAVDRRQFVEGVVHSTEFHSVHWNRCPVPAGCLASEAEELCRKFRRFEGPGRIGYITNFLGGITDVKVIDGIGGLSGMVEGYPVPRNFHGDVLEWVGTLRAVVEAGERFTMIELGAGWAPWCVAGYLAAKQRGVEEIRLIAVEAGVGHIAFVRDHFAINGVPEECATVVHGIAGTVDGEALFPLAGEPSRTYDGAAIGQNEATGRETQYQRLPSYRLETLARGYGMVDLIHCDIQGAEAAMFQEAIGWVQAKVRRVVIGTHSFGIDRALVNLFGRAGWELEGMNACVMREEAERPVGIADGTQVWRNPRV